MSNNTELGLYMFASVLMGIVMAVIEIHSDKPLVLLIYIILLFAVPFRLGVIASDLDKGTKRMRLLLLVIPYLLSFIITGDVLRIITK